MESKLSNLNAKGYTNGTIYVIKRFKLQTDLKNLCHSRFVQNVKSYMAKQSILKYTDFSSLISAVYIATLR